MLDLLTASISWQLGTALCVLFAVYLLTVVFKRKNYRLPPGPVGFPVIGYLPFLTKNPHLKFQELSKKYGKVFSLHLGSRYVVVLNNVNAIKEAFSKPEFLGRPPSSAFEVRKGIEGINIMIGQSWIEHRRFALQSLRDLGLGKSHLEEQIKDEISHFLKAVDGYKGAPFNIKEPLTPSMSNNICSLVYGQRYEYSDPKRILLDNILEEITKNIGQTAFFVFLPWTKFLLLKGQKKLVQVIEDALKFVQDEVQNHKDTLDPNNIRDFIDGYLSEMQSKKEKNPNLSFTENRLIGSVVNLFGAGSETVRTTIGWCLNTMAAYPEVQKRVQEEIDDVIGNERLPTWLDQKAMPYTHSVLMEVQRWQTVAPLSVFRYTLDDVTVFGYNVPKGTMVMANLWAVHHDPDHWAKPDEFIADRFLSDDRKSVVKTDNYMPFSTGRRACPGETLAVVEVFLYFTSILQRYQVRFPKGVTPDLDGVLGLTYQPKSHTLSLVSRH